MAPFLEQNQREAAYMLALYSFTPAVSWFCKVYLACHSAPCSPFCSAALISVQLMFICDNLRDIRDTFGDECVPFKSSFGS